MLAETEVSRADVIAFPDGRGTEHMTRLASKGGRRVIEISKSGEEKVGGKLLWTDGC